MFKFLRDSLIAVGCLLVVGFVLIGVNSGYSGDTWGGSWKVWRATQTYSIASAKRKVPHTTAPQLPNRNILSKLSPSCSISSSNLFVIRDNSYRSTNIQ